MKTLPPSSDLGIADRALAQRAATIETMTRMCEQTPSLATLFQHATHYCSRLEHAIDVAFEHHQNQFRHDGELFVNHPLNVARCVAQWGADANTVIAALLHDVVEDSPAGFEVTLRAIGDAFGSEVAWTVWALTKSPAITDKAVRNLDAFHKVEAALAFGRVGVAAVKLADRLHNSCTAQLLSPGKRERLEYENTAYFAPLAQRLGAHEVARALHIPTAQLSESIFLDIATTQWLKTLTSPLATSEL